MSVRTSPQPTLPRLRRALGAATLAGAASMPALGADLDAIQTLSQAEFRGLSEDLGAALSYKPLLPTVPLGLIGFDLGVAVTATSLKNDAAFAKARSGSSLSTLPVPTLRLAKGLPGDFDIGLAYAKVPGTNLQFFGGELRYAILSGTLATPAVGVRLSHTQLSGVDQLGLRTTGIDVSASKGFAFVTPYVGVGQVWIRSTPKGIATLQSESLTKSKLFGGVNVNLGLVNLAVEADTTGGVGSYGAKLGFRF